MGRLDSPQGPGYLQSDLLQKMFAEIGAVLSTLWTGEGISFSPIEQSSGLLSIAYSQSFITLYWCQRNEGSLAKEVLDLEHSISLWLPDHEKGSGSKQK